MSSSRASFSFTKLAQDVYQRYAGLTLRERVLVTLSVLAVTWMVWSTTIGGFIDESKVRIERDISAVYARMQAEMAQQSALESAKANDPNARLGRERVILDEELKKAAASMDSVLSRFVPPQRMPVLLEDIIRHHKGLKLKRMHSLPVETIVVRTGGAGGAEAQPSEWPQVYKHPLRLEFEGDYFEVLAYLAELESSDWEFGWRRLDYVVTDHPLANVTLEIETLSQERGWIGV